MTLSDVIREVTKLSINSFKWLLLSESLSGPGEGSPYEAKLSPTTALRHPGFLYHACRI